MPQEVLANSTAATQVHARLRQDILSGQLEAGQKLRMAAVAAHYGVGSIPIREALSRLVGEGMVSYSEQKGFTVATVSLKDFADLTRARSLIAETALRESILQGDSTWEERILLAHHRLGRVPRYLNVDTRQPNPDYDSLHREFHSALLAGCGSSRIVAISDELFDHAERYRNLSRRVKVVAREDEHADIVQAVLTRDVDAAVALLRRHIEFTYEIVAAANPDGE